MVEDVAVKLASWGSESFLIARAPRIFLVQPEKFALTEPIILTTAR